MSLVFLVSDFEWRWQAFKEKDRRNPSTVSAVSPLLGSAGDNKSVRSLIAKPPKGKGVLDINDYLDTSFGRSGQTSKMTLSTPASLLTHLSSLGFNEVAGEAVDDIDTD